MEEVLAQAESRNGKARTFLLEGIQQAYWVGQSAALDLSTPASYYVEADIPPHLSGGLSRALDLLVQRHEMLRAVALPSGEQQVLEQVGPCKVPLLDLRDLPADGRQTRREALRAEMNARDIPPETWPQFDIQATRDEAGLRLHVRFALWMMDGWSFHLLLNELIALAADPEAPLPPVGMSFEGYVKDQERVRGGQDWQRAWDYWNPRLSDFPGPPSLPLTRRLSEGSRPRFRHLARSLPLEKWARIVEICAGHRITPSLLACAVYAEVLSRYAGSSHFAITVLYSGRFQHLPEAANVIGNFGTTILLEVDASRDRPFVERVRHLQRQFWRDAERIAVSGLHVTRALQQRAGTGPGISVPVTFTAVTAPAAPAGAEQAAARLDHDTAHLQVPQVHLDHQLHFGEDGSAIFNWDYVEELFPAGFVEELCSAHLELFATLAGSEAAWQQHDPRPASRPAPAPAPLPEAAPERLEVLFERQAARYPDRTAVAAADRSLTYTQLRRRALEVARILRAEGAGRGDLVAVTMQKGWEQVVAVLAVLYAGAGYVPIDPDLPAERRDLMFRGSGARIILTRTAHDAHLAWPSGPKRVCVDRLPEGAEVSWSYNGTASDLAYVIYTSGSTGLPKGVMIDHRGAWNTIVDLNGRFGLTPEDKVLALSSLSFDLSVYDIFGTLAAGAAIVMPDAARAKEASHWRELVSRHGVTVWNSVPALMQLALEGVSGASMPSLRLVMLSGDWIPLTLPELIRPAAPEADIWSLGGATEASIWSVLYPIGDIDPEWRSIPYGSAMDHQSIHVLDGDLRLCPAWVPGDLYIGGIGVALGYLGDEARTAASFVRHPETGERLYRTGDLGRYLAGGEIEFLGRRDFQVKIQGYRVECAEVEAALLRAPELAAAVVTAAADKVGTRHLVGYLVAKDGGKPLDTARLRERLAASLPAYMVPTIFMNLPALPLSDNGKVVRSALPAPEFVARHAVERAGTPPRDALEEEIAALWRDVLGTGGVGREDNFFQLGGSSFAGMRLMAKLEERFKRRFAFATLVTHPTVGGMADVLREGHDNRGEQILVQLRDGEGLAPLFCVHPIGGNVMCYAPLARALPKGRAIYGLRAPGLAAGVEAPLASIADMAARYIEEIRAVQPRGPHHLVGWSLGGLVVQEMARRLEAEGEKLGLTVMIDSAVPGGRTGRACISDGALFRRFVNDVAEVANLQSTTLPDLEGMSGDQRISWLVARMGEGGVPMHAADLQSVYSVFEAGSAALDNHEPRRFEGELLLFEAVKRHDADRIPGGWEAVASRLEVVPMDEDHYSIMRPPAVEQIAARIDLAMAQKDSGREPLLRKRPASGDAGAGRQKQAAEERSPGAA